MLKTLPVKDRDPESLDPEAGSRGNCESYVLVYSTHRVRLALLGMMPWLI